MDKKSLSERDICTKFITPALRKAGWDEMAQIREEVSFTKGRIIVRGKLVSRGKGKRADYILYFKPNIPIALIEAKDNTHAMGDGTQQGLEYAETLKGDRHQRQLGAAHESPAGIPLGIPAFIRCAFSDSIRFSSFHVGSSAGSCATSQPRTARSSTKRRRRLTGFLTCSLRHMRERYVKRPADEQIMQAALRAVEKKQLPHMLCVTNMLLHGIEAPSFVRHDNTLARPYVGWEQKDRVDIVLTNPPFGGKEEDGIESNFPQHFRTRETADLFLALIIRVLKPGGRAAVVLPDGSLFGEGVKTRLKEHLMEECNLHTIVRLPNSVFRPYASIGTNLLFFEKGEPTGDIWFYEHLVPDGQKAYSMTRPIRLEHLQGCIDWWGGAKREGREETEHAWKVMADEVKARGYNLDIKNPHTVTLTTATPRNCWRT